MSLDLFAVRETQLENFNITHNLTEMARKIPLKTKDWFEFSKIDKNGNKVVLNNLYKLLWRWNEYWATSVETFKMFLPQAIQYMALNRKELEKFNSENWWGTYESLLKFCSKILDFCENVEDPEEITFKFWI